MMLSFILDKLAEDFLHKSLKPVTFDGLREIKDVHHQRKIGNQDVVIDESSLFMLI